MACGTFTFFYRAMKKFLPLKILFDIAQWWCAQIVFVVAEQTCRHFIERQQSLVCGIVGRVTGTAPPFLTQWLVRHLGGCQFLAYCTMTLNAELRNFPFEDLAVDRGSVGIVTGGAGAVLDRWMGNFGFLQVFGKIRVAFEADIPDGSIEEGLFNRFMRRVTFVAGTDSNGTVHELLLERIGLMTRDAEFGSIFAHFQQKLAGAAVGLVTGEAFTILYRRMYYFLLSERIVALIAEYGHFGNQFPTLPPQQRVVRVFLMVTRQTLLPLYRGMWFLLDENRHVAGGGRAGLREGVTLEYKYQE
jgi:hypothetical protein